MPADPVLEAMLAALRKGEQQPDNKVYIRHDKAVGNMLREVDELVSRADLDEMFAGSIFEKAATPEERLAYSMWIERQGSRSTDTPDGTVDLPVYAIKASDAEKSAQKERSGKYHIGIKDGKPITVPKQWAEKGATFTDFADPVNCLYYLGDKTHVQNALARWAQNKSAYSAREQKIIEIRLAAAAKKQGVDAESLQEGEKASGILDCGEVRYVVTKAGGMSVYAKDGETDAKPAMAFLAGTVPAMYAAPEGTAPSDLMGDIGRIVTALAEGKRPLATKQSFGDNWEDACDNLQYQGVQACWYAFLSTVSPNYGELLDLTPEDFAAVVQDFASALNATYVRFASAGDTSGLAGEMMEAMASTKFGAILHVEEKAGKRHNKADEADLMQIIKRGCKLLGIDPPEGMTEKKDEKTVQEKDAGKSPAPDASTPLSAEVQSALQALRDEQAEALQGLQAANVETKSALDEEKTRRLALEAELSKIKKQPLPDPTANDTHEKNARLGVASYTGYSYTEKDA